MSVFFFANNFHFALEIMGAVAFLLAAWLTFDTYTVRKEWSTLARTIGLALIALWQILYAVTLTSDLLSYFGFGLFIVGSALVVTSFLKRQVLQVQAIIVVPSFALVSGTLNIFACILLAAVAYFSFRRSKDELNKAWIPFSLAFALLSVAAFFGIFQKGNQVGIIFLVRHLAELGSFIFLTRWAWQYLALRIRESMVIILVAAALFLSTLVTLAFSTILISQITTETEHSLLTDARVLDLDIGSLKEEALAKTALVARDEGLASAVTAKDFSSLESSAEAFMEQYQLGFVTITDTQGNVLVRAHALSRRGDSLLGERALEEALHGTPFVTVEESPVEKLSIRAGAPIVVKGKTIGAVIAGYPLDNALVDSIKRVTGLEMFVYQKDIPVAATALAEDGRTRLTGVPLGNSAIETTVLEQGQTITARTELFGRPFHASYLPLKNGDDKIVGMISAAKPEQDILDIANATNRLTLITVILIMLLLAYPIYIFTKRLTTET